MVQIGCGKEGVRKEPFTAVRCRFGGRQHRANFLSANGRNSVPLSTEGYLCEASSRCGDTENQNRPPQKAAAATNAGEAARCGRSGGGGWRRERVRDGQRRLVCRRYCASDFLLFVRR